MSRPNPGAEIANSQECFPDIASVIEMARKHFIAIQGREPGPDECIFDQEPPNDLWPPAVICCPLVVKELGQ